MQRSGSQKALLVISIIEIVVAAFILIGGIIFVAGGAMIGANPQTAAEIASGTGMTGGEVGGLTSIVGFVILLIGGLELLVGILGIRAANDNQKIMPVWVLALIALVLNVLSLFGTAMGNSSSDNLASTIVSIIVSILVFWVANNVKKEAGK